MVAWERVAHAAMLGLCWLPDCVQVCSKPAVVHRYGASIAIAGLRPLLVAWRQTQGVDREGAEVTIGGLTAAECCWPKAMREQ